MIPSDWIYLETCNVHVAKSRDWFVSYTPFQSYLLSENQGRMVIHGIGTVEFKVEIGPDDHRTLRLDRVFHVPDAFCNFLSGDILKDYFLKNDLLKATVCDRLDGRTLCVLNIVNWFFCIQLSPPPHNGPLAKSVLRTRWPDHGQLCWPTREVKRWLDYCPEGERRLSAFLVPSAPVAVPEFGRNRLTNNSNLHAAPTIAEDPSDVRLTNPPLYFPPPERIQPLRIVKKTARVSSDASEASSDTSSMLATPTKLYTSANFAGQSPPSYPSPPPPASPPTTRSLPTPPVSKKAAPAPQDTSAPTEPPPSGHHRRALSLPEILNKANKALHKFSIGSKGASSPKQPKASQDHSGTPPRSPPAWFTTYAAAHGSRFPTGLSPPVPMTALPLATNTPPAPPVTAPPRRSEADERMCDEHFSPGEVRFLNRYFGSSGSFVVAYGWRPERWGDMDEAKVKVRELWVRQQEA